MALDLDVREVAEQAVQSTFVVHSQKKLNSFLEMQCFRQTTYCLGRIVRVGSTRFQTMPKNGPNG